MNADRFVAHDASFAQVVGSRPRLVELARTDAHEGPVYVDGEDALYFTTRPQRAGGPGAGPLTARIRRLPLSLDGDGTVDGVRAGRPADVAAPVTMPNGMTIDAGGRLLVCEQGDRTHPARVSRLDRATGQLTVVADAVDGLPLNSPNDVAVAPDGAVWFTDPSYGYLQGFRPEPALGDFVLRTDPVTGRTEIVADGFDKPNGLAFSPDGTELYVADSGAIQGPGTWYPRRPHHVEAFAVVAGGRRLGARRTVAVIASGYPDGLKVDADGRLYVAGSRGVQVLTPEGVLLGEIGVPGAVNFAFGGAAGNVLLVTADTGVWAAVLEARGPRPAPALTRQTGG